MREKFLGFLAYLLIRFLGMTYRYELFFKSKRDGERFRQYFKDHKPPFLIAFFHQDELCLIDYFRHKDISVMVSISKDGQIMTNAIERLGFNTIKGSSSKKAVSALISAVKAVMKGGSMAFAVDGPRGPIYKVKEGVCSISKKTNTPIIPMGAKPSHVKIFKKSWNQAKLPLPFSKIEIHIGELKVYSTEELERELISLKDKAPVNFTDK